MILNIEDNIISTLKRIFEHDKYNSVKGRESLKFFRGFLPGRGIDEDVNFYPCILVTFNNDKYLLQNGISNAELTYNILIGMYAPEFEEEAYHDCINIYERIKQEMIATGRLGEYYVDRNSIQGLLNPEQPEPYIWFQMNITFKVPVINTNLEEETYNG